MLARLERNLGSWRWPKIRPRAAATMLGLVLAIALVQAMTVRAALLAESSALPGYAPFVWHMSGALGVWFALPVVQCAVLNAPSPHVGWMARLDPARFVQVHRSDIVALDTVAKLQGWTHGDALLELVDGSTLILTRTYRAHFLQLFHHAPRIARS